MYIVDKLINAVGASYISAGIREYIRDEILWSVVLNEYDVEISSSLAPFDSIHCEYNTFYERESLATSFLHSGSAKANGIAIRFNRYCLQNQLTVETKQEYDNQLNYYIACELDYEIPIEYSIAFTGSDKRFVYEKFLTSLQCRYQYSDSYIRFDNETRARLEHSKFVPATQPQVYYIQGLLKKNLYVLVRELDELTLHQAGVIIQFLTEGEGDSAEVESLLTEITQDEFDERYYCTALTKAGRRCKNAAFSMRLCAQHLKSV